MLQILIRLCLCAIVDWIFILIHTFAFIQSATNFVCLISIPPVLVSVCIWIQY